MKKNILIVLTTFLVIIFIGFLIYKNISKENLFSPKIALVNGIAITKDELDKQISFQKNFYSYSKQNLGNFTTLEKDVLDRLIEDKLVEEYAKKHNIKVEKEEITSLYNQKISKKKEEDLLNQLNLMYGMKKEDYLKVLEKDILREKVQKDLKIPLLEWLTKEKQKAEINITK